jgi:hypothetical protein
LELTVGRDSFKNGRACETAEGIEQRVRASPDPERLINSCGVHSMPSGWVLVNTGFVDRRHKQNAWVVPMAGLIDVCR